MTITETAPIETTVATQARTRRPSSADVVSIITAQHPSITAKKAEELIDFMRKVVAYSRRTGEKYLPYNEEIASIHPTMEAVMPDDAISVTGSAHRALEDHLLEGNELGLVHTRLTRGRLVHCGIGVSVGVRV